MFDKKELGLLEKIYIVTPFVMSALILVVIARMFFSPALQPEYLALASVLGSFISLIYIKWWRGKSGGGVILIIAFIVLNALLKKHIDHAELYCFHLFFSAGFFILLYESFKMKEKLTALHEETKEIINSEGKR